MNNSITSWRLCRPITLDNSQRITKQAKSNQTMETPAQVEGTWYQKPKLSDCDKPTKRKVKEKKLTRPSIKEVELSNSLFHHKCVCNLCRRFDQWKEQKEKAVLTTTPQARVPLRKEKDSVREEVKAAARTKPMERKVASNNIFACLKLDDPGNGPEVSQPKRTGPPTIKTKSLKGGAKTKAIGMEGIFDAVVKVAENHGIKVKPDKPNAAAGDCLFDSIVDNVNHRPEDFSEKLLDGVDNYRELWVTELEEQYKKTPVFPGYHGKEMTNEQLGEWTAAWTQQKNPCEYNVDMYNVSDLTPQGLGHCIKRNILVFSTDPNEPVQIFKANFFDKDIIPTTEVPVVIAYDHRRLHYESILPKTKTEVNKCTMLANALLTGTYDKSSPSDYLEKARKAKQAEAKRNKRSGESPVAKRARLEKVKTTMANTRSNESIDEKQARTEQDKKAKAEKRSNESIDEKQARTEQDKKAKATKRATPETREAQNKRKADRKRVAEGITGQQGFLNAARRGEVQGHIEPVNLGQMDALCTKCYAWMFPWETHKKDEEGNLSFGLCCAYGKYKLAPEPEFPPLLQQLMTGDDQVSREFRRNIRQYNNALAFASRGFSGIPFKFPTTSRGPPIFKVSGQIYHTMGNVLPNKGEKPQFSQMYVYDEQHELDNRMENVQGLNRETLKKLQEMMHSINEFAKVYKSAAKKLQETNAVDVHMVLKARTNTNSNKVYKFPKPKDVAIIVPKRADNDPKKTKDVVLYKSQETNPKGNKTVRISSLHQAYDPTAFPLLFPYGNYGFGVFDKNTTDGTRINTLKFYRYKMMERDNQPTLHNTGRLYQEWLCDVYSRVEEERLSYIEHNQQQLRGESLDGLEDALASENTDENAIGKVVKLPTSFVLSSKWMYAHLLDALAIARQYQKFSWFITMTCDSAMLDGLERARGQTASDRPDLLDRMFRKQLDLLMKDLTTNGIMGKAIAWVMVPERQMRGLWHGHISLLTQGVVPESEVDNWVMAQIPDYDPEHPERNPEEKEYYELVSKHMLHGPCGARNPNSPCMIPNKDGVKACKAGYPKSFTDKTYLQANGYPCYARPDNGRVIRKNGVDYDNRWVVPHNRYLLLTRRCHINVEYTCDLGSIRYQFKYFCKGDDVATVQMKGKDGEDGQSKDEIALYVNSRYIDPHLAVWRLFEYGLQERHPAVMRLDIHEEGKQFVCFTPGDAQEKVQKEKVTKLMAWFRYNAEGHSKKDTDGNRDTKWQTVTYAQFPEHYTYNDSKKEWKPRKREAGDYPAVIGRIHAVPRTSDDKYFLRMLLHHQKGSTSFEDLRTVDGQLYPTNKAAAGALGLLSDDKEIEYAMGETWTFGSSAKLRSLFAILLNYSEISSPQTIYDMFKDNMMDDLRDCLSDKDKENQMLIRLDDLLQDMGSSMGQFADLPQPNRAMDSVRDTRAFRRERYVENIQEDKHDELKGKLANNKDQLRIFNQIVNAIDNNRSEQFVINAPGGCGKTFLFECLSTYVRSQGQIALNCASTGIAAWNLEGGRTAHSMFKIPINADEDTTSSIRAQTSEAAVIREAKIIIWDEIFNVHQHNIGVVDRLLQDVMQNKEPFGGKIVIFGGDPRQTPPVVKKGKRGETVAASFKSCPLYGNVTEIKLTKNMRVKDGDEDFCQWLLDIGEGSLNDDEEQWVEVPQEYMAKSKMDLIEHTFPNIESMGKDDLMSSGIFCPRNDDAFEINRICLNKLPGQERTYLSCDRVEDDDCVSVNTELLNSRRPSGFPDHNLVLKVGAPVMLLRNLQCGLVNGTRMIVKAMHDKVLECEIMVGHRKGEIVFIPRIPLYDRSNDYPWCMVRIQFPVRVCFAMTIHKGQGQSMLRVGVYVDQQMFAHGQLYVAVSRAILASGLKIFVEGGKNMLKNIVYKEIL